MKNSKLTLLAGDLLALGVVTVIGFATHEEINIAMLPRMLTTFVPLSLAWLLIASLVADLVNVQTAADPRQVWRPAAAMLLAGPLAALLRAFALNTTVIPVFAVVLSGTSCLAMLLWRAAWLLLARREKTNKSQA